MNVSMSAVWAESAMSNSEVRIMFPKTKTWSTCSQMTFACGFLIVVGLRFMPYESHNVSKCNLNSNPLLYIKYRHLRYLHNQILLTNRLIRSHVLSKISSSITFSLPLTFLVVTLVIVGISTISSQSHKVYWRAVFAFEGIYRIGRPIEPPKECILLFRWKMSIL